jgi:DNA-binding phage protein
MALTRSYKETIQAELKRDPEFRKALYGEAVTALLEGEQAVAFSMLRDLVHASISFKRLAEETGVSEKSLHRMLGANGNPTIQNIGKILKAIQQDLGYVPQVTVSAA